MNVQDYIASGSIESCVLQLANEREQREFDRLCMEYPEIQAARLSFEISIEKAAMEGAVTPASYLRDSVLSVAHISEEPSLKTAIVSKLPNYKRLANIAALILLAASTALNFYLYRQFRQSQNEYALLLAKQYEQANTNNSIQTRLNLLEKDLAMMMDPKMIQVKLEPMNNTNSMSTVYWDSLSKNVYLLVNRLPKPAAGQQYQLWAMVDGNPVDAGMVPVEKTGNLIEMKNIPKAQAFAITLEKSGGNASPTLTALYVMGKI